MAAFDHIEGGMYGISLKPRLLRSLIKEKLPDEKYPFRDSSELLHVASTVRSHRLLSESASQSADQKLMENWKSVVDSWVNRLLILVSSNTPDKCWAGVCLLGVTCEECSPERFLSSYSVWFNKLLSHIQSSGESHFVKVASCASVSDLFTRLSGFPNVKKDATSHAVKVIQPILKLLNEDNSDASREGAICLLYTVTTFFPSAVHKHYDSVEAAIVFKIMSGKCSANILKKLGHCLALLPKSKGDEDSWLLMMHKILISINFRLKDAFQGLEEETKNDEVMTVLVPPGKDPPTPLGGPTMSGTSYKATKRPELLLMCSVSTLMRCCCTMLTSSYPVQITVPVQPLLMLAGRVLMVDGSVPQTLYPFMTTMQQEFICSELPVLHLHSLELLTAIVKGVRSQLLPHVADIARLLTEYFRKCALPELRTKVYSIIRILLMSMGVGMALYLTQDVISNTFIDLDYIGYTTGDSSSNLDSKISYEALPQPVQKKRKHVSTTGSLEQPDKVGLEVMVPKTCTPMSVKIAALNTLEALLTMGGAIRSESWRPDVDRLLITIATDAGKGGWAKEENNVFLPYGPTNTWAEFQLAALKALLASLLSPGRVRPPFLAQGLELFRRGIQETGTKLSEFCSHALLALEVLIHPRALPLIDFASDSIVSDGLKHRFRENIYSGGPKFNTSFSGGTLGDGPFDPESDEDDLYKSWLGNDDEVDITVSPHPGNNATIVTERPSVALKDHLADKLFSLDGSSVSIVPQESGGREVPAAVMKGVRESGDDEIMTETRELQETIQYSEEAIAREDQTIRAVSAGSMSAQSGKVISDSITIETMDNSITMGEDVLATIDGFVTTDEKPLVPTSNFEKGKGIMFELDAESSEESIPDIVDEEPDSD